MRYLLLVLCVFTLAFGSTIQKEHHFIGKINDMKLRDGILYVAGEGGLLALNSSMQKVFINQTLTGVEKIEFVNVDSDSKSEIFVSNWLAFALIDDNGAEISSFNTWGNMVTSPLPVDIYKNGTNLNIALLERSSSYQAPDTLVFKSFDPQNEWYKFPDLWRVDLNESMSIPSSGVKFRNGKLYSLQYDYASSYIYEHSLANGSIIEDLNVSGSNYTYEIDPQNDLLMVGTTASSVRFYRLSDFTFIAEKTFDTSGISGYTPSPLVKSIKTYRNFIAVVANNKGWLDSTPTSNTVYLYEYRDNTIIELFHFNTSSKETKALVFEEIAGQPTLLFGAQADLYRLDFEGHVLEHTNLDNGVYDPYYNSINAIALGSFGTNSRIIGALDIYATHDNNTSTRLYYNGQLINALNTINIDADPAMEMWASDWYRTYVYDDNGDLLYILPKGPLAAKSADMNKDGINDFVVLVDGKIKAYNTLGNLIFDLNTTNEHNVTDHIIAFDIKDIDNDGIQDIAYMSYTDYGSNSIKIVNDANATLKKEAKIMQPATNIHLFEYVSNPSGGYSVVFNIQGNYRLDINATMGDYSEIYIGGSAFVSEYFTTALISNMDDDPEMELIIADNDHITVHDIFFDNVYEPNDPIKQIALSLGDNTLRGIALFDGDIIVAADNILARYSFNGTKKWEYNQPVDSQQLEDNHFTHLKPIYDATNGNHKIFVTGYSLYEFDANGNFISKTKGSERYMVPSGGNYANPFDVRNDGTLVFGQMGLFSINTGVTLPLPTVPLSLVSGWNLVSLPVDTALNTSNAIVTAFPNARYIWKYANENWYFYSANAGLVTLAQGMGYETISQINAGEGFWIYNSQNEERSFSGNGYNLTQKPFYGILDSEKWHLLGTGQTISIGAMEPQIAWVYSDGQWQVYLGSSELIHSLGENTLPLVDTVAQGKGFWIYKK